MTTVPERATSGRHALPELPTPRPAPVDRYVPETSEVTDRLYVPPQLRAPTAVPYPTRHPVGLAVKRRNPVGVWLGLPLITLGIYGYVWYYKIHREMAEFDRRRVVPVAGPVLVLLFLAWTVVAPFVSFYNTGNRIADAQRAAGLRPTCSPGLGLLLCFCFGLQLLYYQVELNRIADSYGVAAGTQVALRA